jgi:hypothetical protein
MYVFHQMLQVSIRRHSYWLVFPVKRAMFGGHRRYQGLQLPCWDERATLSTATLSLERQLIRHISRMWLAPGCIPGRDS